MEFEQKYNQSKLGGSKIIVSVANSQAKSPKTSPLDSAATYDSTPRQTYVSFTSKILSSRCNSVFASVIFTILVD